jgi:xyloglucan-specific exo-beta-1,4-glucanase
VWVSTDKGLFHSTNFGASFTAVEGVTQAWAVGLGSSNRSGSAPSVFAAASIGSVTGYFRSDDEGSTWVQVGNVKPLSVAQFTLLCRSTILQMGLVPHR